VSSSSSRTPAAAAAGAKSQVTNLVGAAAVLVVLVWLPGLFRNLPSSTLAAIVIASALTLIDVRSVVRLARIAPGECVVSVVAFLGVALLGVLPGIGLAIALALLSFLRRAWMPHSAELVRVDGLKGYHDRGRHPEGRRVPGLLLYRFDAPLFFANADVFKEQILRLVDAAPEPVRWVVVTAEPITDVDATAGEMLTELRADLVERGVVLGFAEFKGHARERLARLGGVDHIGEDRFFRTIGEAVHAYVAVVGVDWTDWEDIPDRPA
jgi:MFS superfamily sulfate permease-like transporter